MQNFLTNTIKFGLMASTSVLENHSHSLPPSSSTYNNDPDLHWWDKALLAMFFTCLSVSTALGNLLVVTSVLSDRQLRRPQNYLIVSLAVADLLVAVLVMPFAALQELYDKWHFGLAACELWSTSDICVCSCSILHLVAIGLDRLCSVTDISYSARRTHQKALLGLSVIWLAAVSLSLLPALGWKEPTFYADFERTQLCMVSQARSYQIFATTSAFFLPLLAIMGIYGRLFMIARARMKLCRQRRLFVRSMIVLVNRNTSPQLAASSPAHEESSVIQPLVDKPTTDTTKTGSRTEDGRRQVLTNDNDPQKDSTSQPQRERARLDQQRERRTWTTLAVVTGSFVACWLPFFTLAALRVLLGLGEVPGWLDAMVLWLGYTNSLLNPLIYTAFNTQYRHAFKQTLMLIVNKLLRRNNS